MKKLNLVLIITMCIVIHSCSDTSNNRSSKRRNSYQQTNEKSNNFLITRSKAGNITIGMPIKKLKGYFPERLIRKTQETGEGYLYEVFHIFDERGKLSLRIEPAECQKTCEVWKIGILNSAYKTDKGVGVGSSYADLTENYEITWTTWGEPGIVVRVEEIGLSFILDETTIPDNLYDPGDKTSIPPDTKIIEIIVV